MWRAWLTWISIWLPFLSDTFSDKIGLTHLNFFILNSMPNSWSKQAYVQGFDYKYISLKKYVNMFEQIDISGFIYEGVLEPSY